MQNSSDFAKTRGKGNGDEVWQLIEMLTKIINTRKMQSKFMLTKMV
jgi:hypothetical protein